MACLSTTNKINFNKYLNFFFFDTPLQVGTLKLFDNIRKIFNKTFRLFNFKLFWQSTKHYFSIGKIIFPYRLTKLTLPFKKLSSIIQFCDQIFQLEEYINLKFFEYPADSLIFLTRSILSHNHLTSCLTKFNPIIFFNLPTG